MELVRNGGDAYMRKGEWNPSKVRIEILFGAHDLSPGSNALIVVDHGSGMTEPKLEKYFRLGEDEDEGDSAASTGSSQMGIGRLAAFSLNRDCVRGNRNLRFYVLTRTQPTGPVMFIPMIPANLRTNCDTEIDTIDPNSAEMGPLKGIKGSFTAIVIPNTVFKSSREVRDALVRYLPRKQKLMFDLKIDDRQVHAPELPKTICSPKEGAVVDAFIGKVTSGQEGGIVICDKLTGLPVDFAPDIGRVHMPSVLCRTDVYGAIFVQDGLARQDAGRGGLNKRFLESKPWIQAMGYLEKNVVPDVQAMLGEDELFDDVKTRKELLAFAERCHAVYENPEEREEPAWTRISTTEKTAPAKTRVVGGKTRDGGGGERKGLTAIPLRIGDRTYDLCRQNNSLNVMAEVDRLGEAIFFNPKYGSFPTTKEARAEHIAMGIFLAIGAHLFPSDAVRALGFAADRRRELFGPDK
jgi:hypothetical protein